LTREMRHDTKSVSCLKTLGGGRRLGMRGRAPPAKPVRGRRPRRP
jgi:hypothetical protein